MYEPCGTSDDSISRDAGARKWPAGTARSTNTGGSSADDCGHAMGGPADSSEVSADLCGGDEVLIVDLEGTPLSVPNFAMASAGMGELARSDVDSEDVWVDMVEFETSSTDEVPDRLCLGVWDPDCLSELVDEDWGGSCVHCAADGMDTDGEGVPPAVPLAPTDAGSFVDRARHDSDDGFDVDPPVRYVHESPALRSSSRIDEYEAAQIKVSPHWGTAHSSNARLRKPVFIMSLRRDAGDDRSVGIAVTVDDFHLAIIAVSEVGLVAEWNRRNAKLCEVRIGDRIAAVNGQSGTGPQLLRWFHAASDAGVMRLKVE